MSLSAGVRRSVDSVQFLRFVAALMVVIYHANIFTNAIIRRAADDPLMQFAGIGAAGVPVFFVISGFIMFHTSAAKFGLPGASKKFFIRRLLRIFPIYWIALALFLLAGVLPDGGMDYDIATLLGIAALLPGYSDIVISPAWTLTFELYFYLAFGTVLLFSRNIGLMILGATFVAMVSAGRFFDLGSQSRALDAISNPVLIEFLVGVAIGVVLTVDVLRRWLTQPWVSRTMLLVALAGFAAVPKLQSLSMPALFVLGGPSALIVAGAVYAEWRGGIVGIVRRWAWLGDSSYSLYLIHILAMSLSHPLAIYLAENWGLTPLALVAFYSVVSVCAGLGLYYLVEKPILSVLHAQFVSRTAAVSGR